MPKAINASIREIPVTISAFSMGMLVTPMRTVLGRVPMLLMAMQAATPMTVAMRADSRAISRVLCRADIIFRLANISAYQRRVKPPHWVRDLDVLKDRIIMVTMGAYRKTMIATR